MGFHATVKMALCLVFGMVAALLAFAFPANAAVITSSGPLTSITTSEDLNCAVNHSSDSAPEFYGSTACGTLVATGGTLFGPANIPAGSGASPRTTFTAVSQSAVTGTGSGADPFTIVTVVDLGTTGLRLTQTDRYVVGDESYQTDIRIDNTGTASADVIVYRAGDCFLQNSDAGYGAVDAATGAVACTTSTDPGARIEQWFPITSGSHYFESGYSTVWSQIGAQQPFPDSCLCATFLDNGAGLSWNATIAAGGSARFSHLTTFSPLGRLPLATSKTADSDSAQAGGTDGYTIRVSNPNPTAVTLSAITDTLPAGFSYVAGSTSGATTGDPAVSGSTLTWSGSFSVPGASGATPGTITLHFGVRVSTTAGDYLNNAGGESSGFTVVPTGDTARITVTAAPRFQLSVTPPSAENPVGSAHTATAHLVRDSAPVSGERILFSVSGANSRSGSGATNAGGDAPFTYTGTAEGLDTIQACHDANGNASCDTGELTASATKRWVSSPIDCSGVRVSTKLLEVVRKLVEL